MMHKKIALMLLALLPSWGWAQSNEAFAVAGTSEPEVRQLLSALQGAVQRDERPAVAALFACPCRVWDGKKVLRLKKAEELLPHYEAVFGPELKKTIAEARVDGLFSNWQGVMLGDGRVWFTAAGKPPKLAISTINAPP
ncbi:hypothetical protein [Paucibacter sp. M5-1]|uniref:hypothetical protein n=1 Tax=Paucibacter sp. M5-1 TaxID=3015998 RepID=UPI0022B9270D|nr:hypothetical protein [Paucibacter sp. M5-1]MCZ7880945.1 hypothetical protein [Paucibacter sp. M5-1]